MNKLIYSKLKYSDYDDLIKLYRDSFYDNATGKKELNRDEFNDFNNENNFFYIGRNENNDFISCIKGFIRENNIWVSMIMVKKPYLRNGYAKEIYNEIIKKIMNGNINYIYISIAKENHIAISFWMSIGFQFICQIKKNVLIYRKNVR